MPRNQSRRVSKKRTRRPAKRLRVVDREQNKRISKLESAIEKKYHDADDSDIISSALGKTATPTLLNNQIYPLVDGIAPGDGNRSERTGSQVTATSLTISYIAECSPVPSTGTKTKLPVHMRVMLVEDKDPSYAITSAAGGGEADYQANPVLWDHIFEDVTNNDTTPVQMINLRDYNNLKARRFAVHYDRVHKFMPGHDAASTSRVTFTKGFGKGRKLRFREFQSGGTASSPEVNQGKAPLNCQFYLLFLSDQPLEDGVLTYWKSRLRYNDA